jgi:GNAT superfamily N-acetyltransferase
VLEPRTYTFGPATAKLRRTGLLSKHMRHHTLELYGVFVPKAERRQGHGAELVNQLLRQADREHVIVLIQPGAAAEWFKRFGFVQLSEKTMVRNSGIQGPRPKKRVPDVVAIHEAVGALVKACLAEAQSKEEKQ